MGIPETKKERVENIIPAGTRKLELLNKIAIGLFGRGIDEGMCVACGSDKIKPEDFRDDLSRKEYSISFLCQECQDKVFGKE